MIYSVLVAVCDGCHKARRETTLDLAPNGSLSMDGYSGQVRELLTVEKWSEARMRQYCPGCTELRVKAGV